MKPEEKVEREMWWLLQEIKREQLLTNKEEIDFKLREDESQQWTNGFIISNFSTQAKLLKKFEQIGILKYENVRLTDMNNISKLIYADDRFDLYIDDYKFNELYSHYGNKYGFGEPEEVEGCTINNNACNVLLEANGDLFYKKKKIVNVRKGTHYFFFLKLLYDNFSTPVGHKEIFNYCNKLNPKTKLNKNETEQEFCNDKKSEIAKKTKNFGTEELFSRMVIEATTNDYLNGYMMCNPE